jgi:hypothetical protein
MYYLNRLVYFTGMGLITSIGNATDRVLPELSGRVNFSGKISSRDKRIFRMGLLAAKDAMHGYQGKNPASVFFCA